MHRAWHIVEIRQLIFDQCKHRDLAVLARCCKYLFEPATDELWITLRSLQPFLSCLPSDLTTRDQDLQLEDVRRLDLYSRKVRKICLEEEKRAGIIHLPGQFRDTKRSSRSQTDSLEGRSWKEVWTNIALLRPAVGFLPNLRHINVSGIVESMLYPLLGISGACLEHICIRFVHRGESQSLIYEFLDRLGDTSMLEYLFVRGGEPDVLPSKVLENAPLRHLRVSPRIPRADWRHVGGVHLPLRPEIFRLETLEHLTLGLTSQLHSRGPSIATVPRHGYLPALKSLWLNLIQYEPEAHGPRSPTIFFENLGSTSLELLSIKFHYTVTCGVVAGVMRAASENGKLRNLTELVLNSTAVEHCHDCRSVARASIEPGQLRSIVQSLLPLSRLKLLRLRLGPRFLGGLDLELHQTLAKGLPALETLQLRDETLPLHHLAAFCHLLPNLRHVEVGRLDSFKLETQPREDWQCPQIATLCASWLTSVPGQWSSRQRWDLRTRRMAVLGLQTYFPNSDFTAVELEKQLRDEPELTYSYV